MSQQSSGAYGTSDVSRGQSVDSDSRGKDHDSYSSSMPSTATSSRPRQSLSSVSQSSSSSVTGTSRMSSSISTADSSQKKFERRRKVNFPKSTNSLDANSTLYSQSTTTSASSRRSAGTSEHSSVTSTSTGRRSRISPFSKRAAKKKIVSTARRQREGQEELLLEDSDEDQDSNDEDSQEDPFVSSQALSSGGRRHKRVVLDSGFDEQSLRDEASHLCAGILTTLESSTVKDGGDFFTIPNIQRSVIQSTCELAVILSDTKNRQILLKDTNSDTYFGQQESILSCILNVIGAIMKLGISDDDNSDDASSQQDPEASKEAIFIKLAPLQEMATVILYFISLGCTRSQQYGSPTSAVVEQIQHAMWRHSGAMQGALHLVLADPLTAVLRGKMQACLEQPKEVSVQATTECVSPLRTRPDPTSAQSTGSSSPVSAAPEGCEESDGDPTKAGRRRRKAKRQLDGASSGALSPERKGSSDTRKDDDDPVKNGRMIRQKKRRLEQSFYSKAQLMPIPEHGMTSFTSSGAFIGDDVEEEVSPSQSSRIKQENVDRDFRFAVLGRESRAGDSHDEEASTDSQWQTMNRNIATLSNRVIRTLPSESGLRGDHICKREGESVIEALPLVSLLRIVTGRIDESDDDQDDDNSDCIHTQDVPSGNPLERRNSLLGDSGVIPMLSLALSETLGCGMRLLKTHTTSKDHCGRCLNHLLMRTKTIVTLIDEMCLLHTKNRKQFCREGMTEEFGGCLIVGLISFLWRLVDTGMLFEDAWGDIASEVLRILISLTHENEVAARDLEIRTSLSGTSASESGIDIIAQVLQISTDTNMSLSVDGQKLRYDSVICCLNALTNYVESGGSRKTFYEMEARGGERFLSWLVQWLVLQTRRFQNAMMGSTFGESPSKASSLQFDKEDHENLVLAANGFILLSWLMIADSEAQQDSDLLSRIQEVVLAELPGETRNGQIAFVKNTLKAFCNFYHISVGELSVTVVEPVKDLIRRLEVIT